MKDYNQMISDHAKVMRLRRAKALKKQEALKKECNERLAKGEDFEKKRAQEDADMLERLTKHTATLIKKRSK